jgi:hypothetical protein
LASLLDAGLESRQGIHLDGSANWAVVVGRLNLSHDQTVSTQSARCEFKVLPDWRSNPPLVWCREPWVRNDWNWHAGAGGILCYVLDREWQDSVTLVFEKEGPLAASHYASSFCLRNVRWLLYRHYIGYITKMPDWPAEWKARPHGEAGYKDYLKQLRATKSREPTGNKIVLEH